MTDDPTMTVEQVDKAMAEIKALWKNDWPIPGPVERHWRIVFKGHRPAVVRSVIDDLVAKGCTRRPDPGDFSGLCFKKLTAQAGPEPSTVTENMSIPDDELTKPAEYPHRVAAIKERNGLK